jgi:hypothetical protein
MHTSCMMSFLEDYILKEHLRANMMKINQSNLLCHKYSTLRLHLKAYRLSELIFFVYIKN